MRHAIVNQDTLKVVNVVIWEGAEWLPPKDHLVIQDDWVNTGDVYDPLTGTFSSPSQLFE
jgi:hypothetical protein